MSQTDKILLFVALSANTAADAAELGRLFFTQEQRAQLEYRRQHGSDAGTDARPLRVDGIVQKHGGRRTVWINGEARVADGASPGNPASQSLSMPGQSQPVEVKVGQQLRLPPAGQ